MYARFEKEAWASGGYVTAGAVMIICSLRLLAALAVRLVGRLVHWRMSGTYGDSVRKESSPRPSEVQAVLIVSAPTLHCYGPGACARIRLRVCRWTLRTQFGYLYEDGTRV
jgi:hypothetical protein